MREQVVQRLTAKNKLIRKDGKLVHRLYAGIVHHRWNGDWEDFDSDIKPKNELKVLKGWKGSKEVEGGCEGFFTGFWFNDKTKDNKHLISVQSPGIEGDVLGGSWINLKLKDVNGNVKGKVKQEPGTNKGNKYVEYKSLFGTGQDAVDVTHHPFGIGVKTFYKLHSKNSQQEFIYTVKLPNGFSLNENLSVVDAEGKACFWLAGIYPATDAEGKICKRAYKVIRLDEKEGDFWKIKVEPTERGKKWLEEEAVYPIMVDPTIVATTDTGHIESYSGASWAEARSGNDMYTYNNINVNTYFPVGAWYCMRGLLRFDTSILSADPIGSAKLYIMPSIKWDDDGTIHFDRIADYGSLDIGDWGQTSLYNEGSVSVVSLTEDAWYSRDINDLAGINVSGHTAYWLREDHDKNNIDGADVVTKDYGVDFYGAYDADAPYLEVSQGIEILESVSIAENLGIVIPELFINALDNIDIIEIAMNPIFMEADDSVAITEDVSLHFPELNIDINDEISIDEYADLKDPLFLNGLKLWLDASDEATVILNGGGVETWKDKSVNGDDITEATPDEQPDYAIAEFNGLNALFFDGLKNRLAGDVGVPWSGECTMFAVYRSTDIEMSYNDALFTSSETAGVGVIEFGNANDNIGFRIYNQAGVRRVERIAPFSAGEVDVLSLGTIVCAEGVNAEVRTYFAGGLNVTATDNGELLPRFDRYKVGQNVGNKEWEGYACEIIVYDRLLSDSDREYVENYLMAKWGVEKALFYVENIGVTENVNVSLDVLNVDVAELSGLLVTEHVDVIDLVVEIGVVADFVGISEDVSVVLPELNVLEGDTISIVEDADMLLDVLNADVFTSILASEDVVASLDVLNFDVLEPFHVLITESVVVTDLVVEVGVVTEIIPVAEFAGLSLTELNFGAYDTADITEDVSIFVTELFAEAHDDIAVDEYATVFDIVIELFAFDLASATDVVITTFGMEAGDGVTIQDGALSDYISMAEDTTILIPELNVSEHDNVAIEEYANVLDIIVELGVFDDISVIEFATVFDIIVELYAQDIVSVVEDFGILIPLHRIVVDDGILVSEYVQVLDLIIELFAYEAILIVENFEYIVVSLDLYPKLFDASPRKRIFETEKITRFEVTL